MAEINITPFTDVLLVLLIIFMILAALVTPPGFEKELPNKNNNSRPQNKNKNDIEVDVNNKGVIFVDGTKTDDERHLRRDADERRRRSRNHHVSIIADAKAPYGIIIRILDAAKHRRPRRRRIRHFIEWRFEVTVAVSTGQGEEEVMSTINITPFTDVLLVLLIIFIILASVTKEPKLPDCLRTRTRSQPSQIVVIIDEKNTFRSVRTR